MPARRTEIASGTLATSVYDRLRQDILETRLEPELKLRVGFVRERYDAGNSPVREALNRLSSDGLVEQRDQRGFYVAPVSRADLEELTRTRIMMEGLALKDAIERATTEWEEGCVIALHRLSRVKLEDNNKGPVANPDWEFHHRAFHHALISACGSHWMMQFCGQLADQAYRYRQLAAANSGPYFTGVEDHRAIMDAAIEGDADRACEFLAQHYRETAQLIIDRGVLEPDDAALKRAQG
jgi:DNA-binding GntR family transcriptional regulator